MRTAFLGSALIVNLIALAAVIVSGHDVGPLDELATVLAGAVAGATLPKS